MKISHYRLKSALFAGGALVLMQGAAVAQTNTPVSTNSSVSDSAKPTSPTSQEFSDKLGGTPGLMLDKRRSTYCFRHTYATFRLSEGVDVLFLAHQMGTSVKMIQDHYGHITPVKNAERILQGMPGWMPAPGLSPVMLVGLCGEPPRNWSSSTSGIGSAGFIEEQVGLRSSPNAYRPNDGRPLLGCLLRCVALCS